MAANHQYSCCVFPGWYTFICYQFAGLI